MKLINKLQTWLAAGLLAITGLSVTSCSDDMPAESYFTFTGEMLSDYLRNHEDYSKFAQIIERSKESQRGINLMDLISQYGQFTCFAPTNEAVDNYLRANGYSSVSDIPADICDTIARTHLLSGRIYNTTDFKGLNNIPSINMNDRYLQLSEALEITENGKPVYSVADSAMLAEAEGRDDVRATFRMNRSGFIIPELANDSVENGIVQPVNAVLASSNATVVDLMEENPSLTLFCQAMYAVGLTETIKVRIKDASWNPDDYEDGLPKEHNGCIYTGAQWDYLHLPKYKNYGFTVFACPNEVLERNYGITDLQGFYNYAREIYGGEELDVTDPANKEKLKDWRSPLRRLVGYNILNCKGLYDRLTSICTLNYTIVNPTSYFQTMDSLSTLKVDRLTVTRFIGKGENDVRNNLYLNRGDMSRGYTNLPGVRVYPEVEGYENDGLNGVYYYTDGLADYGKTTKESVFNTRLRMDLFYMFPELMTNNIRDGRTRNPGNSDSPDPDVASPNYWFPNGYLENVKVNEDGWFFFQSQHNHYSSFEGDEFNLTSDTNYDITFNLPSVPSGTYQIRLGFCAMTTRGICQFYFDNEPQGIPFDMRHPGDGEQFAARTGWFNLSSSGKTAEELEQAKKNMHNLGWYHGPRSVFRLPWDTADGPTNTGTKFCDQDGTVRYVICTASLNENKQHTIRIRKVWGDKDCVAMIDYLELVPKSVYGVEGEGKSEDDN